MAKKAPAKKPTAKPVAKKAGKTPAKKRSAKQEEIFGKKKSSDKKTDKKKSEKLNESDGGYSKSKTHTHTCKQCKKVYQCGGDFERADDFSSRGVCMQEVEDGGTFCPSCAGREGDMNEGRGDSDEFDRPCYVISDGNGSKTSVSYEDGEIYGKSEFLGYANEDADAKNLIKAHIRRKPDERNGIPLYWVSDHGNINRRRTVRLRSLSKPQGTPMSKAPVVTETKLVESILNGKYTRAKAQVSTILESKLKDVVTRILSEEAKVFATGRRK